MAEALKVPTMAEYMAEGKKPEVLFWVGCAGSFDDRAKKITKAFVKLLHEAKVDFAVLGTEESCTGDPAKRAGNEFLFQMQAATNIEVLNGYEIEKVVTACPHCFNTIKNEYPALGGNYEVMHHTQFLKALLNEGKLKVEGGKFKGNRINGLIKSTILLDAKNDNMNKAWVYTNLKNAANRKGLEKMGFKISSKIYSIEVDNRYYQLLRIHK
jgi:hypothetical protein